MSDETRAKMLIRRLTDVCAEFPDVGVVIACDDGTDAGGTTNLELEQALDLLRDTTENIESGILHDKAVQDALEAAEREP